MRRLYEIRSDILIAIERMLDPEMIEVTEQDLEELDIEAEEKIKNCAWAISSLEAEIAEADVIIKNAQAYKAARSKAIDRIESDIKLTMEVMGVEKIDRPDCRVTLGAAMPKAEILDEALLPEAYIRVKKEPAKTDILKALKDGVEVPGARLGYGERSLRYPKIKGE